MSAQPLPAQLPGLSAREAVEDALHRALEAFDRDSYPLLESSFTEDATFDLSGTVSTGLAAIRSDILGKVGHMDTTHTVSGLRVHFADDHATTARITATAVAQHYRAGEGLTPGAANLLTGSKYDMDLVRVAADGLWKIKDFRMTVVWTQGSYEVFQEAPAK